MSSEPVIRSARGPFEVRLNGWQRQELLKILKAIRDFSDHHEKAQPLNSIIETLESAKELR